MKINLEMMKIVLTKFFVFMLFVHSIGTTVLFAQEKIDVFTIRDGIPEVSLKLKRGDSVTVVYFGGSITNMKGWRNRMDEWLRKNYAGAKIKMVNAGVGGTGSELGVFRMDRDVLSYNPDLVFVEFAVNDQKAAEESPDVVKRAVEGIVRKIWKNDPSTGIIFFYTIHELMVEKYEAGEMPASIKIMEDIAGYYGIPSVNGGYAVYLQGRQGKVNVPGLPWGEETPRFAKDACHPLPYGHQLYAAQLQAAMKKMLEAETETDTLSHKLPKPLRKDCYEDAKMFDPSTTMDFTGGWTICDSNRYAASMPVLMKTSEPGATAVIEFQGSDLLFFDIIGTNTGQYSVNIDGKYDGVRVRFDKYCTYDRLSWQRIASDLNPGEVHKVTITVLPDPPVAKSDNEMVSKGTTIYIGGVMLIGKPLKQ